MTSTRHRIALWTGVIVGLIVLIVVIRSSAGSSRLQKRLDAIRAAGQPTNARELEQWIGTVRPEEDGGPALFAATDSETLDEAALDRIHAALQYPHFQFRNIYTNGLRLNVGLDSNIKLRIELKALTAGATSAARRHNANLAVLRLQDAISICGALDEEPNYISYLFRISGCSIASIATEDVVTQNALDEPQLAVIQAQFQRAEDRENLTRALIGERALRNNEFAGGSLEFGPLLLPGQLGVNAAEWLRNLMGSFYVESGMMMADFNFYLEAMERLVAVAARLDQTSKADRDLLDVVLNGQSRAWARPHSGMILPTMSLLIAKELHHVATMRCAQTACAIERYRRSHAEQLPELLDELVPTYLSKVPNDPMDGHPLRYRRLPMGYVVYSIGEDGTDDGGVAPANRPKNGKGGWDYTFTVGR